MSAPDAARSGSRSWGLVLIGRVVVLALAVGASAFALFAARAPAALRYRCPMHPAVAAADASARCPICGMALEDDRVAAAPAKPRTGRASWKRLVEQVRAPAWVGERGVVEAVLYRDDVVGLAPDQPARFFAAAAPGVGIDVARTGPARAWDAATAQVWFAGAAPPGSHGSLVIAAVPRDLLVVPSSAILDAPDGPYVLAIDPASRRAVKRPVRIGRDHHGVVAVLSGLADGDEVVIGDAFCVAAELLLRPEGAP